MTIQRLRSSMQMRATRDAIRLSEPFRAAMPQHLDPDCTGYWRPCKSARYLACAGCAALLEPTPEDIYVAMEENRAGVLLLQLTCEGWHLLHRTWPGPRPDVPHGRDQ